MALAALIGDANNLRTALQASSTPYVLCEGALLNSAINRGAPAVAS